MKPQLLRFGRSDDRVVVVDDFTGNIAHAAELADKLAPFPTELASHYPGVRRMIDEQDDEAFKFMTSCCSEAAQFIAGAFDFERFSMLRSSFSMVTVDPNDLTAEQRAPHFDSTDPNYLALLLYVRVPDGSGTAFFRQRATGIEAVSEANVRQFLAACAPPSETANRGYIHGSNEFFEQIGAVEAVPDRLLIYQGSVLHSGIIPVNMTFSNDPRRGRLTANIFVRGH